MDVEEVLARKAIDDPRMCEKFVVEVSSAHVLDVHVTHDSAVPMVVGSRAQDYAGDRVDARPVGRGVGI